MNKHKLSAQQKRAEERWMSKSKNSAQSVMSSSLWPHGMQHVKLPCPLPTPGAYTNYVHWVGDAIQPSHPLLSTSPPVFNVSQCQGLFQWVSSSHQMAKLLELQLQHQFFQWIFRTGFLYDWLAGHDWETELNQFPFELVGLESQFQSVCW